MKYSIENKGTGVVMFRVFVPEGMAGSFLEFINRKQHEIINNDATLIKQLSQLKGENYFIKKQQAILDSFRELQPLDLPKNSIISEVNKKLKVLGFADTSFDQVSMILTKNKCFRSK